MDEQTNKREQSFACAYGGVETTGEIAQTINYSLEVSQTNSPSTQSPVCKYSGSKLEEFNSSPNNDSNSNDFAMEMNVNQRNYGTDSNGDELEPTKNFEVQQNVCQEQEHSNFTSQESQQLNSNIEQSENHQDSFAIISQLKEEILKLEQFKKRASKFKEKENQLKGELKQWKATVNHLEKENKKLSQAEKESEAKINTLTLENIKLKDLVTQKDKELYEYKNEVVGKKEQINDLQKKVRVAIGILSETEPRPTVEKCPPSKFQEKHLIRNYTPSGIKNLGNTCYINTALQCCLSITELRNYLLNLKLEKLRFNNCYATGGNLSKASHLFVKDSHKIKDALKIKQTVSHYAKEFGDNAQHDATHFLEMYLQGLHTELNTKTVSSSILKFQSSEEAWNHHLSENDSIISNNFHGMIKTSSYCQTCGKEKTIYDHFLILNVPITGTSLDECLSNFTAEGSQTQFCCRNEWAATVSIEKYPKYFLVKLERFVATSPNKNCEQVSFSVTKWNEKQYELTAIGIHSGMLSSGGHYFATVLSNTWFNCNDASVTALRSPFPIRRGMDSPYLLVYSATQ